MFPVESMEQQPEGAEKAPFAFDDDTVEVCFNATPKSEKENVVWHRLRRPTLEELLAREQQASTEMIEVNKREAEYISDDDPANIWLWEKVALAVKGYKEFPDWTNLTPELKEKIWGGQKSLAIDAVYKTFCQVEDIDEGIALTGQEWVVRQSIGTNRDKPDYVVRYTLRQPTEAERREYRRTMGSTMVLKGKRKAHYKMGSNLKAYVKLFDALVIVVNGGTVQGQAFLGSQNRSAFLAAIDPIFKQQVILTLMTSLDGELRD